MDENKPDDVSKLFSGPIIAGGPTGASIAYQGLQPGPPGHIQLWVPKQAANVNGFWGYGEEPMNPGDLDAEWHDSRKLGDQGEWMHFNEPEVTVIGPDGYEGTVYRLKRWNQSHNRTRSVRYVTLYELPGAVQYSGAIEYFHTAGNVSVLVHERCVVTSVGVLARKAGSGWETPKPHLGPWEVVNPSGGLVSINHHPQRPWPDSRRIWTQWTAHYRIPAQGIFEVLFVVKYQTPPA